MEHTYVKCLLCEWVLESQPEHDWNERPCRRCNNTRLVISPDEILCNLCGESMCPLDAGNSNSQAPNGLYKARVDGGYDSEHLLDMTGYTFSFCELCLRKLFMLCKIKPTITELEMGNTPDGGLGYVEGENGSWEADQNYYEYREWKRLGGFHEAYLNKMCNSVKDCPNKAIYTVLFSDEFSEYSSCEEHKSEHNNTINATFVKFISNILKPFL